LFHDRPADIRLVIEVVDAEYLKTEITGKLPTHRRVNVGIGLTGCKPEHQQFSHYRKLVEIIQKSGPPDRIADKIHAAPGLRARASHPHVTAEFRQKVSA